MRGDEGGGGFLVRLIRFIIVGGVLMGGYFAPQKVKWGW